MKKIICTLWILSIINFGCTRNNADKSTIVYVAGTDSGTLTTTNNLGKIICEAKIKKSTKYSEGYYIDGYKKTYDDQGIILDSINYKLGIHDGVGVKFHKNGKIAEWLFRMGGIPFGLQSGRDTNGNWTWVVFATRLDSMAFKAMLNNNNEIYDYSGVPIYLVEQNHNIKEGQNFSIANLVAQFQQYKGQLEILVMDSNGNILHNEIISKFEIAYNSYCHFFDYRFKKSGKFIYKVNYILIDKNLNKILDKWQVIDTVNVTKL